MIAGLKRLAISKTLTEDTVHSITDDLFVYRARQRIIKASISIAEGDRAAYRKLWLAIRAYIKAIGYD